MKEKLEKYQVIVYLVLIILIMAVVKVKYGYRGETNNDLRFINKEITPTLPPIPTINKDYPLLNQLPYQGKGFLIEKYTAPMTLKLILNGATQQQAAKDIGVWLDAFGEAGSGHILELEEATPTAVRKK